MDNKRMLIFSLVYYPEYVGGAELAIHEITKRIFHKTISFDLITLRGNSQEIIEKIQGVTVFRVGWKTNNTIFFAIQKLLFPFLAYFRSLSLHKENKYTHVWSMMANQAGFAGLFFKLRFQTVRFILTLQEGDPISSIKRKIFFVYPLFKMIFTQADTVTAISNYLKDFGYSMGAKRVFVIPNGVDLPLFSSDFSADEKESLLQKLSLQDNNRILITTSRLVKKNGIEYVIRALSKLPQDIVFVILGIGPLNQELQNLSQSLGLSQRIRFVGFVDYINIPKYFSVSHAFIRTSLSEGLGNSFLEAMYFGLPTIGTQAGGIPDFLIDGKTGFVCNPFDEQSIITAITRALGSENVRENAKKIVEEKYDWDFISENFKNICVL